MRFLQGTPEIADFSSGITGTYVFCGINFIYTKLSKRHRGFNLPHMTFKVLSSLTGFLPQIRNFSFLQVKYSYIAIVFKVPVHFQFWLL